MELWLDTVNSNVIHEAFERGLLHGVTTNPAVVSRSGEILEDMLQRLLDIQDGPVAIQVVAENREEMIRQAELLTAHSPRIIVKIPVSNQGLLSIFELTSQNIPVMATTIFEPYQALLAFKAGAHYVAPYLGRIKDKGRNHFAILESMQKILNNYSFDSKIIAAGIPDMQTFIACAELGIAAITVNERIYTEIVADHPDTSAALQKFSEEWQQAKPSTIIPA